MKRKLNCILLVDDNDDCNYFHRRLFNELQCVERIEVATDGQEALDFLLSEKNDDQNHLPEIIFLDLNMPIMDGMEFLEEYQKFDQNQKDKMALFILTTSSNPNDKTLASKYIDIKGFQNKLLTRNGLKELFEKHFP
ncbi:MAG: response regulator [Reichenbachiella sp.]|uniref:response regulator n=1 Tax=Reichenbachiella sp. TaxID=2184521 RepID=UPI00326305D4